MKFAIDTLERKLEAAQQTLRSMEETNARQLQEAAEYEEKAKGPAGGRALIDAAHGLRQAVAWYEQNAIPKERQKIAELEEALRVLRTAGLIALAAERCTEIGRG